MRRDLRARHGQREVDFTSARIVRYGFALFGILIVLTTLSYGDRLWMHVAAVLLFGWLLIWIGRDAWHLWTAAHEEDEFDEPEPEEDFVRRFEGMDGDGLPLDHGGAVEPPATLRAAPPRPKPVAKPAPAPEVARKRPASAPGPGRIPQVEWVDVQLPKRSPTPPTAEPVAAEAPSPEPADELRLGMAIRFLSLQDGEVRLAVEAADGRDRGATELCVPLEEALRFAEALRGFPRDGEDRRDVSMGACDLDSAAGGMRVVAFTRQGAAQVFLTLWPDRQSGGLQRTASLAITADPGAFTGFAEQLAFAPLSPGTRVDLAGAEG